MKHGFKTSFSQKIIGEHICLVKHEIQADSRRPKQDNAGNGLRRRCEEGKGKTDT